MLRAGLTVTTQTLWDHIFALSKHLEPTYEALHAHVLRSPVVGADETTWRLMEANRPKTWWAWSVCSTDAVYYHIHPSRSAEAAAAILRNYSGIVICDGYTAHSALRKNRAATRDGPPPFTLAHCWAHVRRKFIEAEPHAPRAGEMLDLIGKLYEVEAEARASSDGDLHERLAELREARSRETVAEIRRWMLEQRALPGSSLGKGIRYTDGIWQGLIRFLENPAVDLGNNATERTMRGVAGPRSLCPCRFSCAAPLSVAPSSRP